MNDVEKLLKIQNAVKQMIANGETTEYIDGFLASQGESAESLKQFNQRNTNDIKQDQSWITKNVTSPVTQFAKGATAGFIDEANAGFDALTEYAGNKLAKAITGKADIIPAGSKYNQSSKDREATFKDYYNRNLEQERALAKDYQTEHPLASAALNIAGGVVMPVGKGLTATTLGGKIAQGAGLGGGLGALYGLGEGEGGVGNRLGSAVRSGTVGAVTGAALPAIIEGTKTLGKHILGMTTGTGSRAIERASEAGQRGSKEFLQNMRGEVDEKEVVNYAKDYVKQMKKQATDALVSAKGKITDEPIDVKPIRDMLNEIKTSLTYVNPEEAKVIKQADKFTKEFLIDKSRHTIGGADELKRAIGKISVGNYDTAAGALKTKMYNSVKGQITAANPTYSKIMEPFEQTAQTLDKVSKELSLNNKTSTNIYTTLGKLQSTLRNDAGTRYGARMGAVQSLGDKASEKILDSIAGQSFATAIPRGLAARLVGISTGGKGISTGDVAAIASLPVFSPRAVGETVYKLGQLSNVAPSTQQILKSIIATQGNIE